MNCELMLSAILLLVVLLEAEFICFFASFNYMSNNANREAGRTLTREVLLSVRSTARPKYSPAHCVAGLCRPPPWLS